MNTDFRLPGFLRKTFAAALVAVLSLAVLFWTLPAKADSVGQVQTGQFFAPETIKLISDRLFAGQGGLSQGDIIYYIINFATVANGATVGAGGYVTSYVPPGTEVVGAWFVQPSGNDFTQVAPPQAARMPNGWGTRGKQTYNNGTTTTWKTDDATSIAMCAGQAGATIAAKLQVCNGRLSEVYADTGIFYSTDPRTTVFTSPSTDGKIRQGGGATGNGYYIVPSAEANLNAILNQTTATTHNYWDASSTNAFGSKAIPGVTPRSEVPFYNMDDGSAPFNAGSAVAGPDTGYKLDYTGNVGPWHRIYYPGSMIGSTALGPATADANNALATIAGSPTIQGWGLSPSNPLPPGTNAVRWANGRLTVGVPGYVKIALRLTAPPPSGGIISNAEVFGGDASNDVDGKGKDMVWRYNVPSVASTNTNLLVTKSIVGVCSNTDKALAQACTPVASASNGVVIPAGFVKIRYRLGYINTGTLTQTSVKLTDVLPYHAGTVEAFEAGNIYVASGQDIRSAVTTSGATLSNNSAAAGAPRGADVALTNLAANTVQQTATFLTLPTLAGGDGGVIEIDTLIGQEGNGSNALASGSIVRNKVGLSSSDLPSGIGVEVMSTVSTLALLQVTKTTSTPNVAAGGTASYTITVTNAGSAPANAIVVSDLLPYTGATADATKRFNFAGAAGTPGTGTTFGGSTPAGTVTTALSVAPTTSGYTDNPNQQEVKWTFPAASTLAAGASFTVSFNATVGSNVPASSVTYNNDVVANYNNGSIATVATILQTAPITVTFPLKVTKTIDCLYNSAGTQCNAYTGNGLVPSNAKVRYKLAYQNTGSTAQSNVYICDQISSSQSSPAFTTSISQPTIAPTPTGPYQDAPGIGVPAQIAAGSGAETACGYSGANTYAFPVIGSLAAAATGVVYIDLATNVTNTSSLHNTAKIANSSGSSINTAAAVARDLANIQVSKTTSTPTLTMNGIATYTITLTNIGNVAAGKIRVSDFLPFVGTTADATQRFNYVTSPTAPAPVITTLSAVSATTVVAPNIAPNSSNPNQQQVQWYFGPTQTLAPGASATITFAAQAGSALPTGSTQYFNDVNVQYTHGADGTTVVTAGLNSTAPVTIPITLSINKTIDCVFVGTTCTPGSYVSGSALPVNAKIRYKLSYQNIGTVPQNNVVLSDTLPTQTVASAVSNVQLVSGTTPPNTTITPADAGGAVLLFNFATIPSLAPGATGVVTLDVQTNAILGSTVTNLVKIVSTQDTIGQTSSVSAVVSALVMTKTIDCVYNGTTCTAGSYVAGSPITSNAKIRYKIAYSNPGTVTISNVRICDQLPTQMQAATATYVNNVAVTGTSPGIALNFPADNDCAFAPSTHNFSSNNTVNLIAGANGSILYDVQTNAAANAVVTNLGKLVAGAQVVTSSVSATVGVPHLVVTKTVSAPTVYQGSTASYTINLSNIGSIATQTLKMYDFMPHSGTTADITKRFEFDTAFSPTFTYTGGAPPTSPAAATLAVPPAFAPYSSNLNQQQVLWDFGNYALPPGGAIAITFRAKVGSAMPETNYFNIPYAAFTSASGPGSVNAVTALVGVSKPKPALLFLKTVAVTSDPQNLTTNPKNIPGAEVLYTLRVTNTGPGVVDNNTLFITDPIPTNTILFVGDLGAAGSGPVTFVQGTPTSGLTYTYSSLASLTDDLEFSNDNGATWTYVPTAPYDAAVNRIRLNPKGVLAGEAGGLNPYFDLRFRVQVK